MELIGFVMSSTLISFGREYEKYHGGKNREQGLAIGVYESLLLANLVVSYLFEKSKEILNRTTYPGIYCDDGLVVFKGKKGIQEIKYCLAEFQQIVDKLAGNQHL